MASSLKAVAWSGLLGGGVLAGVVWAARQATSATYRRRYDLVPLAISNDEIEFPATRRTLAPGEFGLHLSSGGPPAVIGPVICTRGGKVTRRLLLRPAGLTVESRGRWSGIVSVDPSSVAADVVETSVATPLGAAPAWMIDRGTSCWVVHVHGQGSDRRQTLRGVESATTLGLSSLIVSYRNDGEGPRSRDGRSHLGESEWRDLEAALRFVAERGGTECVVFGWSLGATIALNTVQRSPLGTMIKGIAMVSPVLAWEEVLRANARHQGLPQFLGSLAAGLLSSKGVSRLAGLDAPLEVLESDRARLAGPLTVPVLILHNRNDWSVPIETSSRFAQAHKDLVELVPFDCSGHTQEWNSDRVGWDLAVRRWYGRLFQPGPAEDYVAAGWRMNLDGDEFMVGGGTPRDRLERAETLARKVNLLLDVVVAEGGAPYEFADIQAGVREHGYELSRTRWWRIRSGESPEVVPKEALVALAKFFEVDPAYLTDEAGELPQRIERELQFLKKMRRNKLKNIAARTLGDIDIKTLEAINALLDDVDSYDRNDPERG